MTETLLHSTVSLSGKLSTEIVELLDLLGSSWKEDKLEWYMSIVADEHGNVKTLRHKLMFFPKFVTKRGIPFITSLPPFVQLEQNKS